LREYLRVWRGFSFLDKKGEPTLEFQKWVDDLINELEDCKAQIAALDARIVALGG